MDDKPKSAEKLTSKEIEALQVIEAPVFYASSIQLQGFGNDFNIIFQRSNPVHGQKDAASYARQSPVAVITVSPPTLKDLKLVLEKQIKLHEKEFGKIKTPYMMRHAEKKPE